MRILLALLLLAVPAAADVMVADNNQKLTIDCAKDANIAVTGNDAVITLTGTCDKILVSGNKAKITGAVKSIYVTGNENQANVDAVVEINTSGNKNTVSYKADKKPKVSNTGNKNVVGKRK